jgi:hypothetical protein
LKRRAKRLVPIVSVLGAGVLIAIAVGATPSSRRRADLEAKENVRLSLTLPEGASARAVGYVVRSARNEPLASGSIAVVDVKAPLAVDVTLPAGAGETVTLIASPSLSDGKGTAYLAAEAFDVVAGGANVVDVGAQRFAPMPAAASASGSSSGVVAGSAAAAPDCQTCERASEQGRCDPELLTATWNTDPNGRDQPSWGCDTLATAPQKSACAALLHCLASTHCAQGDSPVAGCFCGSVSAVPCFSGAGIDGPCLPSYRAAAVASVGGPGVTATDAELSRFVATVASNPTTPVGLADNVNECSLAAHCDACGAP